MTDQTESASASEYEGVAAMLETLAHGDGPANPLGDGARAIRALEAEVLLRDQHIEMLRAENALYLIDHGRLAGEVERLRNHTNMWNGCTCWSYTSQEKAHADNCVLSVHAAEVARLTSELASTRAHLDAAVRAGAEMGEALAAARELRKYMKHNHGCGAITWREGAVHCTCGLSEVLDAARSAAGEEG